MIEGVLEIESGYTDTPREVEGVVVDYWLRLKMLTADEGSAFAELYDSIDNPDANYGECSTISQDEHTLICPQCQS